MDKKKIKRIIVREGLVVAACFIIFLVLSFWRKTDFDFTTMLVISFMFYGVYLLIRLIIRLIIWAMRTPKDKIKDKIKYFWNWLTDCKELGNIPITKYIVWFIILSAFLMLMFRVICINPLCDDLRSVSSSIDDVNKSINSLDSTLCDTNIGISLIH